LTDPLIVVFERVGKNTHFANPNGSASLRCRTDQLLYGDTLRFPAGNGSDSVPEKRFDH
jgi:hypothetical protein